MPQGMETTRQMQDKAQARSAQAFHEAVEKLKSAPKPRDVKRKKAKTKRR